MKKVAAIILNFKVKEDTLECIASLKKSNYPVKIFVVDNNSNDGIGKEVLKDKEITFTQNEKNLGYTGGNNIGIKEALKVSDYIFVVNPDVIIGSDTIKKLVEALEAGADIAGPKIYFHKLKKIWFAGGVLDLANVIGSHRGVDEEDKGQYNLNGETDYISGASILIKKQVFEKIGLFDERYFLYYEDTDFCFRTKKAGFKIMYVPTTFVYHKNARSTKVGSPLQDYYMTRNRMLFAAKFLPFRTRFALFREALKNIGSPMRRLALWDFLTGNFGKGSLNA